MRRRQQTLSISIKTETTAMLCETPHATMTIGDSSTLSTRLKALPLYNTVPYHESCSTVAAFSAAPDVPPSCHWQHQGVLRPTCHHHSWRPSKMLHHPQPHRHQAVSCVGTMPELSLTVSPTGPHRAIVCDLTTVQLTRRYHDDRPECVVHRACSRICLDSD